MWPHILYILFCFVESKTIWNKHYITWSVENGSTENFINEAVQMWNIAPIKLVRVSPGKGDLKIYFLDLNLNHTDSNSTALILGQAYSPNHPDWGTIYIDKNLDKTTMFYVIQHEIGHALGLPHYNTSVMDRFYFPQNVQNVSSKDRNKIFNLYNCSFDSVSLLNYQTYLLFQGSYYKRFDYNSQKMSKDTLWFSSEIKYVDAMYRNRSGHYIIISNDNFYKLDSRLRWIQKGKLKQLFPKVKKVNAVLALRNGQIFVISKNFVYKNNKRRKLEYIFKPIVPKEFIKGAYQELDGNIVLVDKTNRWIYNSKFYFLKKEPLCKIKIHCCNKVNGDFFIQKSLGTVYG